MSPVRLDVHLVEAGLARSRGQARDLIAQGSVTIDGRVASRPATPVPEGAAVVLSEDDASRWVGRAALKLVAATELFPEFAAAVDGARCLDVGASTGGFTQVLLEHGAAHVIALDVGHDQLAPAVRDDPRVEERSGVNIRNVGPDAITPVDILVGDLSFISLTLVADILRSLLAPDGQAVLLVKPQFEVGRARLGKSGVVRKAADRRDALLATTAALHEAGLPPTDLRACPTVGSTGNQEYLLWSGGPTVMTRDEILQRADELTQEEP
ncbi:MAG: TlyA family RNA methyltransferase [Mobilicoccus sp.]|nr:TlyA family RNA methyltransferase [Mobilicoccus sp.]